MPDKTNNNNENNNIQQTSQEANRPPLPKADIISKRNEIFNLGGNKKDKSN